MTEDQLAAMARECGASPIDGNYWSGLSFTATALQTFALRIEAQAIKSAQFGKTLSDKESLTVAFSGIEVTLKRYT